MAGAAPARRDMIGREHQRDLKLVIDKRRRENILRTGHDMDIDKGGLYDSRSGCVNIWCSPEDKPACWDAPITQGDLDYAREVVGSLFFDWTDDDFMRVLVDATPYDLIDARASQGKLLLQQPQVTEEDERRGRFLR